MHILLLFVCDWINSLTIRLNCLCKGTRTKHSWFCLQQAFNTDNPVCILFNWTSTYRQCSSGWQSSSLYCRHVVFSCLISKHSWDSLSSDGHILFRLGRQSSLKKRELITINPGRCNSTLNILRCNRYNSK